MLWLLKKVPGGHDGKVFLPVSVDVVDSRIIVGGVSVYLVY